MLGTTVRDDHIDEIPEQDRDKQKSHHTLERLRLEKGRDCLLDEEELVLNQGTLCNPCHNRFIQVCAWGGLQCVGFNISPCLTKTLSVVEYLVWVDSF